MRTSFFRNAALAATIASILSPVAVLAHGHTSFEINENIYSFTVGSLNEPIAVDDKTGVDIRVVRMAHHEEHGAGDEGEPVAGLEKTLKVELIAGDKKKVLELSGVYNAPGSYKANFIPTVQTTYGYRVFGTIDSVPFDYTWQCNPAGHPVTPEETAEIKISEGVTQIEKAGAFGCPVARAALGFPEPSLTSVEVSQKFSEVQTSLTEAVAAAKMTRMLGTIGAVILFSGLGVGVWSTKRKKVSVPVV